METLTNGSPTLPREIAGRDAARLRAYRENLAFYAGDQPDPAARSRPTGRRLTMNYARTIVDKVTSYLMADLRFAVEPRGGVTDPTAADRAARAEADLYAVAEANRLDLLDFETELDAAILGDGAYKVTWDPAGQRVRVTAPDVQGIQVWPAGDDRGRIGRLAHVYHLPATEVAARHGRRVSGPTALIIEEWTDHRLTLWIDGNPVEDRPNPYGGIPYLIFPNLRSAKEFWGISDLAAIREPVRELNRAYSQLSQILELSGNPIAVLENLEASRDIAVAPGAVWEIPERAKAYLLDLLQGGGVSLHVDYINLVYRTLHDLGETPRSVFGETRQPLSGVALEVEMQPLIQKVRRKRLIRTALYRQRAELILRLRERFAGVHYGLDDLQIRVIWAPLTPRDQDREIERARALISAGVSSRRRLADDLGVADADGEFARWLAEETAIRRVKGETADAFASARFPALPRIRRVFAGHLAGILVKGVTT